MEFKDREFIPVLLGGDINTYSVARAFYEQYQVKTYIFGKFATGPSYGSKIIEYHPNPKIDTDDYFLQTVNGFAKKHKDKKIMLIGCGDSYVALISKHKAELEKNIIAPYIDFDLIPVPMTENGPDMDVVEKLVENDDSIKGIWCVPKYSNPLGITFSDETVKRFAALKPAAKDFRIMWDNAYCVHDVTDTPDELLSLMAECRKTGNVDLPIMFTSTSKITFPGSGVAAMAASDNNMKVIKNRYQYQVISYDKMNMLRHARFFGDLNGVKEHMKLHKAVLKPKFEKVQNALESQLKETGTADWTNPNGGYFVSVDVLEGTAKEVVRLCKEAGVVLTDAGATYPYGNDPKDSNIRIAPSFPPNDELKEAMDVFCICAKLAACAKILNK